MIMMKSFLLLLLSSTVSGLGSVVRKQYSYIHNHLTWNQAQSYCRSSNSDLAVFYTQSDADRILLQQYYAWIGLHRVTTTSSLHQNIWKWSDGLDHNLNAWARNEPRSSDDCASALYSNPKIYGNDCEKKFFFICHKLFIYTFIPQSKTWSEAQEYCRNEYDDLASFKDISSLESAVILQDFPVWTGLYKDGVTWKWSSGLSEYRNWALDEPGDEGNCVSISSMSKKMATQNCSARFPFICFRDNLVLVKENKTWEEALEHCRSLESNDQSYMHYDLVSVQPGEDHNYVMTKVKEAVTERVWTGLRFLAGRWLWVNGADMLYTHLPACPPEMQQCGALIRNEMDSLEIRDCTEKRNFLCYKR